MARRVRKHQGLILGATNKLCCSFHRPPHTRYPPLSPRDTKNRPTPSPPYSLCPICCHDLSGLKIAIPSTPRTRPASWESMFKVCASLDAVPWPNGSQALLGRNAIPRFCKYHLSLPPLSRESHDGQTRAATRRQRAKISRCSTAPDGLKESYSARDSSGTGTGRHGQTMLLRR